MHVPKTALATALLVLIGLSSAYQSDGIYARDLVSFELYARDNYLASLTPREALQARDAALDRIEAREAHVESLRRRDYTGLDDGLYRRGETPSERETRLARAAEKKRKKALAAPDQSRHDGGSFEDTTKPPTDRDRRIVDAMDPAPHYSGGSDYKSG